MPLVITALDVRALEQGVTMPSEQFYPDHAFLAYVELVIIFDSLAKALTMLGQSNAATIAMLADVESARLLAGRARAALKVELEKTGVL